MTDRAHTPPTSARSPVPRVLTDGYDLYERIRRGVYHKLDRQGRRTGATCSGFVPRPRWKPARTCSYDERYSLRCVNCGSYDTHYAMTGERSFCRNQGKGWVILRGRP